MPRCGAVRLQQALKNGAKVFGGPKFTVSPVYEGMPGKKWTTPRWRYPSVRYDPQLIDATFALLLATTGEALVIPSLTATATCFPTWCCNVWPHRRRRIDGHFR